MKLLSSRTANGLKSQNSTSILFDYSEAGIIHTINGHLISENLKWAGGYYPNVAEYHDENCDVYIYRALNGRLNVSFYKDQENTYIVYGWGDVCYFDPFTCIMTHNLGEEVEITLLEGLFVWCCENALTWIGDVLYENYAADERVRKTYELQRLFMDEERYKDIGKVRIYERKCREEI